LRIFARENDALLVYCLVCIVALALPSSAAFGIVGGIVAAVVLLVPLSKLTMAVFMGLVVSVGHYVHYEVSQMPGNCFETVIGATGIIESFPESHEGVGESPYLSFDLAIRQSLPTECGSRKTIRAYAAYENEVAALKIGDLIKGDFRLRRPASLWNRGTLPTNVHALASGRAALASVIEITSIEHEASSLSALRYRLSQSINRHAEQQGAERLLQGLLIGRQDALHPEDWSFLREFGIVHVLVVSGVHVSLVALWIQWLVSLPRRFLLAPYDRGPGWVNMAVVSLLSWGYVLLTGASLPAQRAFLMMGMTRCMRILCWRVSPLSSVVASAAVLITLNPWSALTSGFWLSVLLTGVIIVETEKGSGSRSFGWIRLTFVLTLASSILSVFFFHQFSYAALLSNLAITPIFTAAVLPMGLLGLAVSEANSELGGWLLSLVASLVDELIALLITAGAWSGLGHLASGYIHVGSLLLVVATLSARVLPKKAAVTVILLFPVFLSSSSELRDMAEVVAVDVGQGTMVLVVSDDYTLVYDTGGVGGSGTSIAEREVIPWLKSRGISVVDLLIVSHGDLDHSGGLSAVREHFRIAAHWGFGGEPCSAGRELSPSPDLTISVLMGTGHKLLGTNADSCVVLVEAHHQRTLLTGDIPIAAELELIASGSLPDRVDILFAAHHGSATSSSQSFIDKLDPTHTVFTTKRANRFNHPHSVVVSRFQRAGSVLWDTARDGAVTFKLEPSVGVTANGMRTGYSPYWAQL